MVDLKFLSRIGIGTYRMSLGNKENHDAFSYAVNCGINLIDTASNYGFGQSEDLIGYFLKEKKKDLFVVSKAGYVYDKRHISNSSFKNSSAEHNITTYGNTQHCIHPDFLLYQLKISLKRLRRSYIDGYLIHNPEYFLKANPGDHETYYKKLFDCFVLMEECVKKKKIRYYGVSSNTLNFNPDLPTSTDIRRLQHIASQVSSNNHFRLVQFPYNLVEEDASSPIFSGESLIEIAKAQGITTFSNRPLNCNYEKKAIRLAIYENEEKKPSFDAFEIFIDHLSNRLKSIGENPDPYGFEIISVLKNTWKNIANHRAVNLLFEEQLLPFYNALFEMSISLADLRKPKFLPPDLNIVNELYNQCLYFSNISMSRRCKLLIDELKSAGRINRNDNRPIPIIAIENYLQKGIDHVLVGMTKAKYVQELKELFHL